MELNGFVLCTYFSEDAAMESNEDSYLGFTLKEWQRAFEIGGTPRNQAWVQASQLVRAGVDSNGYSLNPESFALLALVSAECEERVRAFLADSPRVLREVEVLINGMRGL
jgi:hypothetical protein